jgi:flagellar biosynthesis chaperone FliJ
MSDTDDSLEAELRTLLTRVLSVQLDALEKRSENLSVDVSRLARVCNDVPKQLDKLFENLHERCGDDAESLKATFIAGANALELQMERLHDAFAETHIALSGQSQEGRQELVKARDALASQSKAQADALISSVTKLVDALGLALNVMQQRTDERSGALEQATVGLAQSFDDKSALAQSRLSALERKIGLLTSLTITAVIVLVVAVAGAGAIYLGVAAVRFPS